ncbi:MAG: FtsW/RodA/SpoVE family cell cycle protein, partial [Oscillospiraceae bacterium]|nr:FtsW/RodA/SpoVE family cell cycle protein [Oscillospiraceae bacterium]
MASADRPISRAASTPKAEPKAANKPFRWGWMLLLLTVFQFFSFLPVAFPAGEMQETIALVFGVYIAAEWMYLLVMQAVTRRNDFPLEILAFFLSGIGLTICASIHESYALKQLIAIGLGLLSFTVLTYFIRSTDRAMFMRMPLAVGAIALLILNLLLAKVTNGALNWITVGSFSFQPSELVKVAFIFVGAATLESLQTTRSLTTYILFSLACVGA